MKGHIRKRAEKTYTVVVELGRVANKRKQKWVTVQGNKKDAEKVLAKLLTELNEGTYVEPVKTNFAGLINLFLDEYAKQATRTTTYENYRSLCEKHIIPELGSIKLDKLTAQHLNKFYSDLLDHGHKLSGGLSQKSVKNIHALIRQILQYGTRQQLLTRNVADTATPPRVTRKEMQTWQIDDARKFLEVIADHRLYSLYVLAIMTGMRKGEVTGLKWPDVDLDAGVISIRRTLVRTAEGLVFQEPKTAKSRRQIPISDMVVQALHRRYDEQEKEKALPGYAESDLIFTNEFGGPLEPRTIAKQFQRLADKAGVPIIRFHDLRHTHATILLTQGVHPKIVSERLGHSEIGVTLDTYSHVIPSMQKKVSDDFDRLING